MSNFQVVYKKNSSAWLAMCILLCVVVCISSCVTGATGDAASSAEAQTTKPADNETAANTQESADDDPQQDIASAVPDTDIFVFKIDPDSAQIVRSFDANVTNRAGYDNQPSYLPGSNNFVFSSILDGRQSDVYEYQEDSKALVQRTATALSEYSPTPLASGGFSSVVVEADGTQRLWRFSPTGRALAPIREDVTGVGYHAWLADNQLALFIVDEPLMHLDVVDASDSLRYTLAVNPGRSLHARPGTNTLSFVQHLEGEAARLMNWDGTRIEALVTMPEGVEDLTWLPDGRALTVANGQLLVWTPGAKGWQSRFNFGTRFPGEVTRLAVNDRATRLAIVSSMTPSDASD